MLITNIWHFILGYSIIKLSNLNLNSCKRKIERTTIKQECNYLYNYSPEYACNKSISKQANPKLLCELALKIKSFKNYSRKNKPNNDYNATYCKLTTFHVFIKTLM